MVGHMWDSTFVHLHIQNWGRNAVYIQERTNDNTNNLTFIHLHLEPTPSTTVEILAGVLLCMGGTTANTKTTVFV